MIRTIKCLPTYWLLPTAFSFSFSHFPVLYLERGKKKEEKKKVTDSSRRKIILNPLNSCSVKLTQV